VKDNEGLDPGPGIVDEIKGVKVVASPGAVRSPIRWSKS
jgi:hypothetical protein